MSDKNRGHNPAGQYRPAVHPHPRELGATRFFARLIAFDLECPRCGKVYRIVRKSNRRLSAQALEGGHTWNPTTARFVCTGKDGCHATYVLGILAWNPSVGAKAEATPEDQVPTYQQLAALRAEGQGHWMPNRNIGRFSTTNIAVTDERPEGHDDDDEIE